MRFGESLRSLTLLDPARAPRVPHSPRKLTPSRNPKQFIGALRDARRASGTDQAAQRILMGFVVPLWMAAGVSDWWLHRRSDIEHTAGTRESLFHAAMMAEGAIPTTLSLFFEVNAGLLATTYGAVAAHQATAVMDVKFANDHREVSSAEQHVHAALEMTPVMAAGMLTAIHWDQARSLVGRGGEQPDFKLRLKRFPLPNKYKYGVLAASAVFVALPYAEELLRCLRADGSAATPADAAFEARIVDAQEVSASSPDFGSPPTAA